MYEVKWKKMINLLFRNLKFKLNKLIFIQRAFNYIFSLSLFKIKILFSISLMASFQFYVQTNLFKVSLGDSLLINVSSPFQQKFYYQTEFNDENLLPSIKTFLQNISEVYNYLKNNSKQKISFCQDTGKFTIKMHVCQKLKQVSFNLQKIYIDPYENLQKRISALSSQLIKMTEKSKAQLQRYEQCQKLLTNKVKEQEQNLTLSMLKIEEKDQIIKKLQQQNKSLKQICYMNSIKQGNFDEDQSKSGKGHTHNSPPVNHQAKSKIQQVKFMRLKKQKPEVDLTELQQASLDQYQIKHQHLQKSEGQNEQTKPSIESKKNMKNKNDHEYDYQYNEEDQRVEQQNSESEYQQNVDKKQKKKQKQIKKKNYIKKGVNKSLEGLKLGNKKKITQQDEKQQILSRQVMSQLNSYLKLHKIIKLQTLIREKKLGTTSSLSLNFHKLILIPPFPELKNILRLNLSNNQIEQIVNLSKLSQLKELNLDKNIIKKIENLDELTLLKDLSLSSNKIQVIENLFKLTSLSFLNLNNNNIVFIGNGLDPLSNSLKQLKLQDNLGMRYTDPKNIQKITILNKSIGCILWKSKPLSVRERIVLRGKQQGNKNS